jgi:hypothetical protein
MSNFESYLKRKEREFGSEFDASDLAPQFVEFYNNNARIEVDLGFEVKRGRIGVTTGWKPCFLLMLTKRSIGSSYTLGKNDKVLRVVSFK